MKQLLYEATQVESAELCFIFHNAHTVLYFPLENTVHNGNIAQGHSQETNIAQGEAECYICLETTPMCNIFLYCMKPCKMKVPNCALFSVAHVVCYIFLVPEILLHIRCNKPVKGPLTLVHYRKYCTRAWSQGKYSTWLRLALY